MKKLMTAALVAGLAGAAWAHEGHGDHAEAKEGKTAASAPAKGAMSMTGEIVDLACYMGHGTKGEKHADCAKQCVTGGAPMGLVTDKGLYLLVNDHKAEKAFNAAKELAGSKAVITGTMANKGGLQAVIVTGAQAAK